jgi:glycosyltransferase involved in cell wall biosynthesis
MNINSNSLTLSVGMPVRNGERYIRTAIDSLLRQAMDDFELIISDNASDDATADICEYYAARDSRVLYSRLRDNHGAAYNYNRTFSLARGRYFKWAAHDDECCQGFFSRCLDLLEAEGDSIVLAYPRVQLIDEDGNPLSVCHSVFEKLDDRPHRRFGYILRQLSLASPVFGVMRASAMRETRLIQSFIGSDFVFLAEMAMLGSIREVPEILFRQRIHAGMSTRANRGNDLRIWYEPRTASLRGVLPPQAALGFHYWSAIWRLPLKFTEKLLCTWSVLPAWFVPYFRNVAGRLKTTLLRRMKSLTRQFLSL